MRYTLPLILAVILCLGLFILPPGTSTPLTQGKQAGPNAKLLVAQAADATAGSDAPALAHGFLIEKHVAAGIGCAGCHGEDRPTAEVPETVCTQCHGGYDELAARFPFEPNPHRSHLGEIPCATCHNIHVESVNFCDSCHSFGMVMP